MVFTFNNKIELSGLRFIKIEKFKNNYICVGSKLYIEDIIGGSIIKKYVLYSYFLNHNLEIIENSEKILNFTNIDKTYLTDLYTSLWIRDIYIKDDNYFLLIDFNKNINNQSFESNNYLLETNDFINFNLIKKYNTKDILHKEINDNLFISKIENNDKINWGKYLFEFKINNEIIKPTFDKYIDYENDNGHLLHNIEYNIIDECYNILFSILNNKKEYKIYMSNTDNFINYYNTNEIEFININSNSNWYCFPSLFNYYNKKFIIANQDDFGIKLNPVIFREYDNSLLLLEEKYNINNNISNKLIFNDNKKYIFYNELENKNGNRYENIIKNNYDLNNYSTHSPSCIGLIDVLEYLEITDNDSIIDIGSGKGWALTLFNLFPFKKITGIELSKIDNNICINNLNLLNIKNIEIINHDALLFNDYDDYNYLYFYNPFGADIFENIIKKIKNINTKVIYNNIHDEEKNILNKYNFILIKEIKGVLRNYFIYKYINKKLNKIII